ncbi:hypothetical protein DFAR_2360006 [Desulfarculales bacterium]
MRLPGANAALSVSAEPLTILRELGEVGPLYPLAPRHLRLGAQKAQRQQLVEGAGAIAWAGAAPRGLLALLTSRASRASSASAS